MRGSRCGWQLRSSLSCVWPVVMMMVMVTDAAKANDNDGHAYRLLKECLSGNSRTAMVATISANENHYHNTVNTLK